MKTADRYSVVCQTSDYTFNGIENVYIEYGDKPGFMQKKDLFELITKIDTLNKSNPENKIEFDSRDKWFVLLAKEGTTLAEEFNEHFPSNYTFGIKLISSDSIKIVDDTVNLNFLYDALENKATDWESKVLGQARSTINPVASNVQPLYGAPIPNLGSGIGAWGGTWENPSSTFPPMYGSSYQPNFFISKGIRNYSLFNPNDITEYNWEILKKLNHKKVCVDLRISGTDTPIFHGTGKLECVPFLNTIMLSVRDGESGLSIKCSDVFRFSHLSIVECLSDDE